MKAYLVTFVAQEHTSLKRPIRLAVLIAGFAVCLGLHDSRMLASGQPPGGAPPPGGAAGQAGGGAAGRGRASAPAPDPTKPAKLEIMEGTTARYKVREQLAGISFPSDAVGTTQ